VDTEQRILSDRAAYDGGDFGSVEVGNRFKVNPNPGFTAAASRLLR
jgi:hypothetical protein